jgi:diguanylate cyclase (GGDEF)-like protein
VFAPTLDHAQLAEYLMVGTLLAIGGVGVLRQPGQVGAAWLGGALLIEGLLFLHYVPWMAAQLMGRPVPDYLSYSSFFDAGAENLVALASLVALSDRAAEALRRANNGLLASQHQLRRLVDLDPLTGLANRRRLRQELRRVQPIGAAILFFDLDGFKAINDREGHLIGDAFLQRAAEVLQRHFRPDDALFRYGGDEFLVIAPAMDGALAESRVRAIQHELRVEQGVTPGCAVSAGVAILPPGGDPDAALAEADRRMYASRDEATRLP